MGEREGHGTRLDLRYPLLYANFVAFIDFMNCVLWVYVPMPTPADPLHYHTHGRCRACNLGPAHDHLRHALRAYWAACCHSRLGTRPHYDPFGENVERRWLVRPASQASFERFERGDGWCFDVVSQMGKSVASARCARESIRACGAVTSADPGW